MDFRIKETSEIKTLSYVNCDTGIDGVGDLIGNSGAIGQYIHRDDDDMYIISSDDYDWWADYISDTQSDDQELSDLYGEYAHSGIQEIIEDEWNATGNDYNDHHRIRQRVIERIKAEALNISGTAYSRHYDKDTFAEMIRDWQADGAPEYDELEIDEPELRENGTWIAYARDEKTAYSLTDDGEGNIQINYDSTR